MVQFESGSIVLERNRQLVEGKIKEKRRKRKEERRKSTQKLEKGTGPWKK